MNRRTLPALAAFAVAAAVLSSIAFEATAETPARDWPQFRGAARNGQATDTGLLAAWPDGGPRQIWRQPLGDGYSEIVVAGDRLYTMFAAEADGGAQEFAAAFEAATGKELWRVALGKRFENEFGHGPRSTPAIDGDRMYVLNATGDFAALSLADGAQLWKVSLPETFGSAQPTFGFSTSALVDGGQVVLEAGGPDGKSYVALDRTNGKTKWTAGTGGREPGYSSPLAVDLGGGPRYVYITGAKLVGLDRSGKEIWSQPWPRGESHAMPVFVAPDRIFASGAEGVGAALYRIKDDGTTANVEELWKLPTMRNHFSTSIARDGHVYGFDNATLKCIRLEDGSLAWAKRGLGKGALAYVDGHLLVLSDQGRLAWVEASAEGYVESGSVQALEGRCWTAPTVAGGRVYLRNQAEMVAYDLRG